MKPDLVQLVSKHTKLRKSGKELKGRCFLPGHSTDRIPSFYVEPSREVFYCHGCNRGGDVYTLLAILTGKPRKSFLGGHKPDLGGLVEGLKSVGRPRAGRPRVLKLARTELAVLFRTADSLFLKWNAGEWPIEGSPLRSYVDYLEGLWQYHVGRLDRLQDRCRAGLEPAPVTRCDELLRAARLSVELVIPGTVRALGGNLT